jgi:hypothetical protein
VVGEALWVNWDGVWAGLASEPTHDGETVMNGAPGLWGGWGFEWWERLCGSTGTVYGRGWLLYPLMTMRLS